MDHDAGLAILLVAVVGVGAQWIAWRLRLPAIIVLAAAGLAIGPGLGWLNPSEAFGSLLPPFVGFAVAVILFEGGLRLKLHELEESAVGVRRLCSVGLLLSWLLGMLAARFLAGLSWPVSVILGAILVVTGPTVIMPLLRHARLPARVASLFKWEAIVNDPFGALAAVLALEVLAEADAGPMYIAGKLGLGLAVGAGSGVAGGFLIGKSFRSGAVPEYLKAPALLVTVLVVYALSNAVQHEAGLLATTVMGVVVGNFGLASIAELTRFKDSITIVLVSSVFVLLTADMNIEHLAVLNSGAVAFLLAMLLVVRPVSVIVSTMGAGLDWNERLLLAWIAPRGIVAAAVAGVFGPRLVSLGHEDGEALVPLVFATIFATVVLHGLSLGWVSRRLGLASKDGEELLVVGASAWTTALASALQDMGVPVVMADSDWFNLRDARLAGVPIHYGEVLSEASEESLPTHLLGAVLAASHDDAYNALVCVHFGPELGRDKVFQLSHQSLDLDDKKALGVTIRGRVALSDDVAFDSLQGRLAEGWGFQKTTFSDEYGFDDWRAADEERLAVLVLRGDGSLAMHGPGTPVSPGDGETLLSFGPPREVAVPDEAAPDQAAEVAAG